MAKASNPLDDIGLPKQLVAEIWASDRTRPEKVRLLSYLINQVFRGISKALGVDLESTATFSSITSARQLLDDASIPIFVEWWLDGNAKSVAAGQLINKEQAQRRENRLEALQRLLPLVDPYRIEGIEGDFEWLVEFGVNSRVPTALDHDDHMLCRLRQGVAEIMALKNTESGQVVSSLGWCEVGADGKWYENVMGTGELALLELLEPRSVRIVGGVSGIKLGRMIEKAGGHMPKGFIREQEPATLAQLEFDDLPGDYEADHGEWGDLASPDMALETLGQSHLEEAWTPVADTWWLDLLTPQVSADNYVALTRAIKGVDHMALALLTPQYQLL